MAGQCLHTHTHREREREREREGNRAAGQCFYTHTHTHTHTHTQKEIVRRGNDAVHEHIRKECKYAGKYAENKFGEKDRVQKEVWNQVCSKRGLSVSKRDLFL